MSSSAEKHIIWEGASTASRSRELLCCWWQVTAAAFAELYVTAH